MDPRVEEILDRATDVQQDYVIARLVAPNQTRAARAIGIHRTTPAHWDNLDELEEAVHILRKEKVEAARVLMMDATLDAVIALKEGLKERGSVAVNAAKAILDRAGLPVQSQVDVTSKGESIKAYPAFGEIVVNGSRDEESETGGDA